MHSFCVDDVTTKTTCSQDSLYSSNSSRSLKNEGERWLRFTNPRTTSLLSLLYLALLTFFGSAVLLAEMRHHSQQTQNVHGSLTVLMLTSSAWMLWFGWKSAKNKKIKMYQDHQAGASWLKGGLCLFALATLVLDCLTLGYYHELQQCTSVLVTSFPIVQAVFTVIQVSLLSFYAKVCIQEKQTFNRTQIITPLPITYTPSPIKYTPSPIKYTPSPITYTPSPITYTPSPITYTPSPIKYTPSPITYTP
ncbi:proton channel OTOP2-like [Pelobates cultripes]|nr:proton channel OTOP2-like [Pelobates cultripes]